MRRTGLFLALCSAIAVLAMALGIGTSPVFAEERYAVLVGIDKYDSSDIANLDGAVNDVTQLGAALIECCGFERDNVFYLTSDRDLAHQPRIGPIVTRLGDMRDVVRRDDAFIFFFSGHGIEQGQRQYLLTQGTNTSSDYALQHTALSLATVKELLEAIPATKKIVIIDSCRDKNWQRGKGSGGSRGLTDDFARGLTIALRPGQESVSFAATLFACQPGHVAWEYPGKQQGFFTYFLTKALRGDTSALDQQGNLTLATLERYLEEKVDRMVKREKGRTFSQVPWFIREGCGMNSWQLARFKPGGQGSVEPYDIEPQNWFRTNVVSISIGAASLLALGLLLMARRLRPRPGIAGAPKQHGLEPDAERAETAEAVERSTVEAAKESRPKAPIVPPPPPQGEDFGDVEQLVAAKKKWAQWQAKMTAEFERLLEYEKNEHLSAADRAELWERFLKGFSTSNPYSDEDDALRTAAKQRIDYWREQEKALKRERAAKAPPPPPDVAVSKEYDQVLKRREKARGQWAEWQAGMDAEFKRAREYDENDLMEPAEKVEIWAAFLRAFSEKNPFGDRNETLRKEAKARMAHWHKITKDRSQILREPGETRTFEGIEFVWIPPGEFQMGSPKSEEGRYGSEGPVRTVRITKGYWMGEYPVTQKQYERVMGKKPSHFKGGDHPVETVSWNDAVEFCAKLTRGSSHGIKYRLPTEAEWEYGSRAGTTTRFYTGDSDSDLSRAGWYGSNSGSQTHEVGQKVANAWNLHDMHGNVWEWCSDWYDGSYYSRPNPDADPTGPISGSDRVLRGGGWYDTPSYCRSANRSDRTPGYRYYDLGFRVLAVPAASE